MGGLRDYFEEIKEIKLSEEKKMKIYENILGKQYRHNFLYKAKFYLKVFGYTFVILLLLLSFYPVINFDKRSNYIVKKITFITGWIYTEKSEKINNTNLLSYNKVFADWIGKIINVKGDFSIIRNNNVIKTDKILDGDFLIIDRNTYLEFGIGSWYVWRILWPAKIKIVKSKDGYTLNLIYGQYLELEKTAHTDDKIKVVTDNFELIPKDEDKVSFKIVENWKNKIVENRGKTPLIIKKIKTKKQVVLSKDQVAQVDGDIKILVKMIKSWKIEEKYSIKDNKSFTELGNIDLNKEFSKEYKIVPTQNQIIELRQLLYPSFLKKDILNLINSQNDKAKQEIAINNLMYRVLKIYKLFDLKVNSEILKAKIKFKTFNIDDLFLLIDQLISKLKQKYYIEPKYTYRLKQIEAWILLLKSWKLKAINYNSFDEIFEKNKNLKKYKNKLDF